jgi:hypothetical protein
VFSVGLTTTSEGEWALAVQVFDLGDTPILEIEEEARGAPVIYLQRRKPPVARPAFPRHGQ